ncbi:MAG: TonB-dependent receptor plug domain-containing protein, partial [Gemmatimonadetes bacterium]|nr:TonB-dependent receptor plug domain-containing protein [Gemmatimonadota bacterium]
MQARGPCPHPVFIMQTDVFRRPARFPRAVFRLVLTFLLCAEAAECARAEGSERAGEQLVPPDEVAGATGSVFADTVDVPASAIERREQAIRSPYPVTWVDFAAGGANLHGLSDLLESVPGVRVKRYGGLGAIATPSVRGSGASQVEVFLDGVPMNSAQW